jgi:hypothetical protein
MRPAAVAGADEVDVNTRHRDQLRQVVDRLDLLEHQGLAIGLPQ